MIVLFDHPKPIVTLSGYHKEATAVIPSSVSLVDALGILRLLQMTRICASWSSTHARLIVC